MQVQNNVSVLLCEIISGLCGVSCPVHPVLVTLCEVLHPIWVETRLRVNVCSIVGSCLASGLIVCPTQCRVADGRVNERTPQGNTPTFSDCVWDV